MKKLRLIFVFGALAPVLAAGCATGQGARTSARTDACSSTTVLNVAPGDARGGRTPTAGSQPVRNPGPQAARGGSPERGTTNRVLADSLAAAGRGSEIAGCLTGLAHAGERAWTPAF